MIQTYYRAHAIPVKIGFNYLNHKGSPYSNRALLLSLTGMTAIGALGSTSRQTSRSMNEPLNLPPSARQDGR